MFDPSRRALVVAAFALGLSAVGPAAHAGLLGGDDSTAIEGVGLPVGGDLLGSGTLDVVTDTTLHCDAAIPQVLWALLGDVTEAVCAPFSYGISGLLGSL